MAMPLAPRTATAPSGRLRHGEPIFFPREVAEVLAAPRLDYRQLHELYRVTQLFADVTGVVSERVAEPGWTRYTLRDVLATSAVFDLAGGREALEPGRRLSIAPVRQAVTALLVAGVPDPLLEVQLHRQGRRVYARVEGQLEDPISGQRLFQDVFENVAALLDSSELAVARKRRRELGRSARLPTLRTRFPDSVPAASDIAEGRPTDLGDVASPA